MGPSGASPRVLAGYLVGVALGTCSITLLFLGMRAVMDVGGACAEGGPYVSAQPCPTGVPLALIGGMFGLFGAAGLMVWFGSRIAPAAASIVALGWPALFIALGFNFLDYAAHPPDGEPAPIWGWLVPGVLFWLMGGAPLAIGIAAWREARAGRPGNRLTRQVTTSVGAAPTAIWTRTSSGVGSPSSEPASTPTPDAAAVPADEPVSDLVDDLERLSQLHAAGDLTDAEFDAAKLERLTQPDGDA